MRRCRLIQITGKSGSILVVGWAAPIRSCTMTAVSFAAVRYALYSAGAALIAAAMSTWGGAVFFHSFAAAAMKTCSSLRNLSSCVFRLVFVAGPIALPPRARRYEPLRNSLISTLALIQRREVIVVVRDRSDRTRDQACPL